MGREILDLAGSLVKPGVTTDEIDEIVHNAIIERNAYPSPMNYREYPKSICTYAVSFLTIDYPSELRSPGPSTKLSATVSQTSASCGRATSLTSVSLLTHTIRITVHNSLRCFGVLRWYEHIKSLQR